MGRRTPTPSVLLIAPLLVLYLVVCAVAQPGSIPVRDEPDLLAAAARMARGHLVPVEYSIDPRSYLWHGPGLVALLAPLVALGLPLRVIRFVDPILLAGAALVFHRLLRRHLNRRPALWWTYAFGLYVPSLAVVPEIHKEPLAILLVVTGMLALSVGLESGRRLPLVAAGACLGALAMVRLEYGWVTFALLGLAGAGWAARRRSVIAPRLVAVAGVASILCLPWLAFTYHLTGKPAYWGSSSGLSLYWMSPTEPGETGEWHSPRSVPDDPALAAVRPFFARVSTLDPVSSDLVLRRHAVANIRARPGRYAENLAANLSRLFFSIPTRPWTSLTRVASDVAFNLALLAAVGWALVALRRRRAWAPPETAPFVAFACLAVVVHLPVSASPRMLLPVVPPLLWLVAQARRAAP